MGSVEWTGEHEFTLDSVMYRSMVGKTTPEQMLLCKSRSLVQSYEEMVREHRPRTILELGIYRGGSAALLAQLARPDKLVAIELEARPCQRLERFIDDQGLRGVVVPYYGTDQADVEALDGIMEREFDGPIDLVIDDASHLEGPTRASFNRLFPHVRPGGLYIIEDWGWPHIGMGSSEPAYQDVTPISAFVCQLVLAAARRRRAITEVTVGPDWAAVRRGDAEMQPGVFDIGNPSDPLAREMVDRMSLAKTLTPPHASGSQRS